MKHLSSLFLWCNVIINWLKRWIEKKENSSNIFNIYYINQINSIKSDEHVLPNQIQLLIFYQLLWMYILTYRAYDALELETNFSFELCVCKSLQDIFSIIRYVDEINVTLFYKFYTTLFQQIKHSAHKCKH